MDISIRKTQAESLFFNHLENVDIFDKADVLKSLYYCINYTFLKIYNLVKK